ncbi:MAG: hypothetical protein VYC34_06230 [Planctomycetota bacterium]|nr:hypothetical protein [Planctomycetota bacterium]
MKRTPRRLRSRLSLLVAALIAAPCLAQPAPPVQDPAGEAQPDREPPREMVRDRLRRELESAERRAEHLREAIDLVDGGASAADIRAHLAEDPSEGRGPDGEPQPVSLDAPEAAGLLATLEDVNPVMAARFNRLRESDPERAERFFRRMSPRLVDLADLRGRDPQAYALRVEELRLEQQRMGLAFRLVRALRESEDSETVDRLRAELRDNLEAQFDLQLTQRRQGVTDIEQRLDRLRGEIAELDDRREELIEQRLEEVVARAAEAAEREPRGEPRRGRRPDRDAAAPGF